ncbi:MAG: FAD-dependent monooxygenase [Chloroflexi bacterium]|nr:FAD-dependent monooxygenase [Chloroflexota bacterium]
MRVAIVGGGIGGMAAAVALWRQGLEAQVYEQAPRLKEVGAGVALHPNGVRMLRRLGLGEDVVRFGARWVDPQFRRFDGTLIAPWWSPGEGASIEIYGMHRADLLQMLLDRVPTAAIHPGSRCIAFSQDSTSATLEFENGSRITADVVVGADGIHSTLQRYVTPPSQPIPSGSVAYRGLIGAASVRWPAGQMRNFLGPGKHFLVFPVRSNTLLNYVGFVASGELTRESWSAPGDPDALRREFAGWDPTVQAILDEVQDCFWWGLYDREPLARWTTGRLTLLGDAAHPMLPHVGQGANQAIEDAVALATVLARADAASATAALQAYEQVRRPHAARVQASSRANGARYDFARRTATVRDRELSSQARDRAWMWDFDAEAEARAALTR